ncbi:MAG TPA: TIGR03435 family protein [Bryobacteraceae bacterium]
MRASTLAGISVLLVGQSSAQNAAALSFEVASVRPYSQQESGPTGTSGGPGTRDPERYTGRGMPLRLYLCVAFATPDCQQQISAPNWIDTEKYDVAANVPPRATKEQFQKMLENLLVERFKLALHHETKTLPVYELVTAKNGPKVRESVETPNADPPPVGPPSKIENDANGFPVLPPGRPGFVFSFGPGQLSHWTARQQPMSALARSLSLPNGAGRQVIDKTGLTGKYDFTLVYDMRVAGVPAADDASALILEDALEQQLGLKLVEAKAPFDFVIIDRGQKVPTEN